MPRLIPPGLISYTEVAFATVGTLTSASVSWLTGDVIVAIVMNEGVATIGTPAATGLSFTQQQINTAASSCNTKSATAVATSASSATVSATSSAGHAGMGVWVWRGSDGVGTSTEQHTATKSKSMTPTDTHSAFCWSVADFDAQPATATIVPTVTNTRESAQDAGHYTVYSGDLIDQASAGATTFGISGGTGTTGPYSLIVQEILGTTAPLVTTRLGGVGYG